MPNGRQPFAHLALELGFTDQSHFMRELKQLVNVTLHAYRQYLISEATTKDQLCRLTVHIPAERARSTHLTVTSM